MGMVERGGVRPLDNGEQIMIKLNGLTVPIGYGKDDVVRKAAALLGVPAGEIKRVEVLRKSLDCRRKPDIKYVLTVGAELPVSAFCYGTLSRYKIRTHRRRGAVRRSRSCGEREGLRRRRKDGNSARDSPPRRLRQRNGRASRSRRKRPRRAFLRAYAGICGI